MCVHTSCGVLHEYMVVSPRTVHAAYHYRPPPSRPSSTIESTTRGCVFEVVIGYPSVAHSFITMYTLGGSLHPPSIVARAILSVDIRSRHDFTWYPPESLEVMWFVAGQVIHNSGIFASTPPWAYGGKHHCCVPPGQGLAWKWTKWDQYGVQCGCPNSVESTNSSLLTPNGSQMGENGSF